MIGDTILWSAVAVGLFMNLFYLISLWQKNVAVVDVAWGLGFIAVAWVHIISSIDALTSVQIAVTGLVTIWGVRLSWHLGQRNLGKPEDWRYAMWRQAWQDTFWWRSYLQIFMLQGLLILIISAPTIVSFAAPEESSSAGLAVGMLIWAGGFIFETIADSQLRRFVELKAQGQTKTRFIDSGLWRYSRHPNYFGEVTQWWGLWLVVVSLNNGWWAIVSPLMITYLILFVSGVPMLEKKFANDKQWQSYVAKTSKFIPLPRRV